MHIDFVSSARSTLGVEWEIALVDGRTGELAPRGQEVLEAVTAANPQMGSDENHPHVTGEFLQNTVEMVTGVCNSVAEATHHLKWTSDEIRKVADPQGLEIFAGGTHPFSEWTDQPIVDKERYSKVLDRAQYWGRQMVIYGLHVHVGVDHRDKALPIMEGLLNHYPHLLALSANSPYWCGYNTGYASHRSQVFQQLPTAGLPFQFSSWDQYESYIQDLVDTGVIAEESENRWDIRPVPRLGTVEMRICDGPTTLRDVGALTALTQCLVESYSRALDRGESVPVMRPWHHQENKWRAARYGLETSVIQDAQNNERPLDEDIAELLERLTPLARQLDCVSELEHVDDLLRGHTGYRRQLKVAQDNGGDLRAVALDMVERNRTQT